MRAEEIIASIYKHKKDLEATGKQPERIILTKKQYETVQDYHKKLGTLPQGLDYIDKFEIFGIPIFISD